MIHVEIPEEHSGGRLDKVLAELSENLSRARIQKLIEQGVVQVNDTVCINLSKKVQAGDVIEFSIPCAVPAEPQPENIPLDVIYEDDDLLVLNKQAGLVVHPGAGNPDGTLVNALLHHCGESLSGIGGVMRPGIVHRLDKDTTGLMVVAKHDKAHQGLAAQLEDRSLSRVYQALVLKVPVPLKGVVDMPIGRDPRNRQKMAVNANKNRGGGKEARTHYHVLENYKDALALVECKLESGRTHQIRVHMAALKHPLIGDPVYGPQPTAVTSTMKKAGYDDETIQNFVNFPRQALQAKAISFVHPITNSVQSFEIPTSDDLSKLLNLL